MSRPRWFSNINDMLDSAKRHGFIVGRTGHHWQIREDRTGAGRNRVIATLPTTGTVNKRLMRNMVSQIKRLTGSAIRKEPPRRHVEPLPELPLQVIVRDDPSPPTTTTPTPIPNELRQAVREAIVEVLLEMVKVFQPTPAPAEQTPEPEMRPMPPPPLFGSSSAGKSVTTTLRKKRVYLSPEQRAEALSLLQAGETGRDVARTFNVSESYCSNLLHPRKKKELL